MVLTEKVRHKMSTGQMVAVWKLTAVAAGATNISAEALGFKDIVAAMYFPEICTISATTTSPPVLSVQANYAVTIGEIGGTGGDSGSLRVYGS